MQLHRITDNWDGKELERSQSLFTYSTFLDQGNINYIQSVPSSYQFELFLKVSYVGNSTSPQTLFQDIHPYNKKIFSYLLLSYCNLSLLPFIHLTLNKKDNLFPSTLHLTLGISRCSLAIFTPHISHYGTGHVF